MVKKKLKIYANLGSHKWIPNSEPCYSIENSDIIIMPGGADWNPKLYGELPYSRTHFNSKTDTSQLEILLAAIKCNKFIIGICRGLQGLHIAAGGKLIQHVTDHVGEHHPIMDVYSTDMIMVNSIHHQMVDVDALKDSNDYTLIAKAWPPRSKRYEASNHSYLDITIEPEVVYYWKLKGLGFQYHPESLGSGEGLEYSIKILNECYAFQTEFNTDAIEVIDRIEKLLLISKAEDKQDVQTVFKFPTTTPQLPSLTTTTPTPTRHVTKTNWISNIKKF